MNGKVMILLITSSVQSQIIHDLYYFFLAGVQRTMYKIELWLRSANAEVAEKLKVRMLDALSDGEASKENSRVKMPDFEFKRRST